jgi:serine/threonine protein kinase
MAALNLGNGATPPINAIVARRYRIERVLGVGGMGVVYLATHLVLNERIALKFMQRRFAGMPEASARFVREGRSQFRIASDHVVRVLDVGQAESGEPVIAMEYVEGASLRDMMDRAPIDLATACEIVRQMCRGIASAHALGIVHRDIKPANVLVTTGPGGGVHARVLDFGVAQTVSTRAPDATRLTSTAMVLGTLSYMAPEQLRASKLADERSDVWSLGAVLYELLTGRLPYEAESPAEMILRQLESPPPWASVLRTSVPPGLAALVDRCLVFEPKDRTMTAVCLAEELGPYTRQVPTSSFVSSGTPHTAASWKRWIVLPASLLPLAVALGWVLDGAWSPEHAASGSALRLERTSSRIEAPAPRDVPEPTRSVDLDGSPAGASTHEKERVPPPRTDHRAPTAVKAAASVAPHEATSAPSPAWAARHPVDYLELRR